MPEDDADTKLYPAVELEIMDENVTVGIKVGRGVGLPAKYVGIVVGNGVGLPLT